MRPSLFLLTFLTQALAISLDENSPESICSAAGIALEGATHYWDNNKGIGLLTNPYYWWHAGGMWGGFIDYWFLCQNDTWEEDIYDALVAQRGEADTYIPANQSTTEGNDDQGFWGMAIMEAAERNFTNPKDKNIPGWLAMTQGVFNTMWARWDVDSCGGGLRWQIFTWNSGYNYKNTISTACMFNLATRLGRYTGNDTYFDVANEAYEWLENVGFLVDVNGGVSVYDGAEVDDNCTSITMYEWTYNYALLLAGNAYAYNATGDDKWLTRVNDIMTGCATFFIDNVMYEKTCQGTTAGCNNDQRIFKAFFARSLGQTASLVDSTTDQIMKWLRASAAAAAQSCVGGSDNVTCGLDWQQSGWDGKYGLGEQMSAAEVIQSLLVTSRPGPYTNHTGGSSVGDPSAGISSIGAKTNLQTHTIDITGKDKAGAGVITAVVLAALTGGAIWMVV